MIPPPDWKTLKPGMLVYLSAHPAANMVWLIPIKPNQQIEESSSYRKLSTPILVMLTKVSPSTNCLNFVFGDRLYRVFARGSLTVKTPEEF